MTPLKMNTEKHWWRSKTVWLGLWELLIGALTVLADSELTHGDLEAWLLVAAGLLTVGFRFFIREPLAPIRIKTPR